MLEERVNGEPSLGELLGKWVVLAARLLGDFGVRPSEKARFWAGEREFGAKRKRGEAVRGSSDFGLSRQV